MARARNLKPSFFTNDKLAELDPLGRLLFAGLWTIADREGRLEDRPKRIKAEILPYDDADADRLLLDLQAAGFIMRYSVNGGRFIQVLAFTKHQNPHVREGPSTIPAPDKHSASTVPSPEIQEPARLIPPSPIPLPDSKKVKSKPSAPAAPLPEWLAAEDWERWRKHRGRKAEGEAGRLQIAKLDTLRQQGHDPPAMISAAIESGWATFYPPRAPPMQLNGSAAQGRAEVADFIFKRGRHGSGEQKPGAERDITGESERVA
ncbi:MAG: hypothetical protein IPH55_16930 [Betaproteobacteria bacterium]|nr:hypothetical protein [Betaproteobacteria bacterium]